MAYGVTHSATLPTVGTTPGPTYATLINAAISEIRSTVNAKVTPAGIDISSDLSFLSSGDYWAITDLERAHFENKSATIAAATFPVSLFVSNGELYFNDNNSRQIQITDTGAVNVSTTGGITGAGYGSAGVEVAWDAGTTEYQMRLSAAADGYANVRLGDVFFNDGSSHHLRMTAAAMAADYTVTWPAAVPASTLPVLMDSSGVLSTSGTLANLVSITTSGNATIGGTGSIAGDLTMGANADVVLSGTGIYRHGTRTKLLSAFGGTEDAADGWAPTAGSMQASAGAGVSVLYFPVVLDADSHVATITIYCTRDNVNTITARFCSRTAAGVVTTIDDETTVTGAGTADVTMTLSPATTLVATTMYWIEIERSAPDADLSYYGAAVHWTTP